MGLGEAHALGEMGTGGFQASFLNTHHDRRAQVMQQPGLLGTLTQLHNTLHA